MPRAKSSSSTPARKQIKKLLPKVQKTKFKVDTTPNSAESPFEVGTSYLIRTVTMTLTGRVKAIKGPFLILEEAAWIADTGRFSNAIKDGNLNEVEPVDDAIVGLGSVVDAFVWKHVLPRTQK